MQAYNNTISYKSCLSPSAGKWDILHHLNQPIVRNGLTKHTILSITTVHIPGRHDLKSLYSLQAYQCREEYDKILRIAQIAEYPCFSIQIRFGSTFKTITNLMPSQYQKNTDSSSISADAVTAVRTAKLSLHRPEGNSRFKILLQKRIKHDNR